MLEEHVESNLRRWGFLFTEMVLIVASILLAFALDSWWDERKDREEEQQILIGLRDEFSHGRGLLVDRIEQHETDLRKMETLLAATYEGEWTSKEFSVDATLAAMIAPPTTDLGKGVLDALISSGRIELLRDQKLRALLAAWASVFGEVSDDEHMSRAFVFDRVIPYMIEHAVPISGPMGVWWGDWAPALKSVADSPEELARLLGDRHFAVMLEARLGFKWHTSGEYEDALDAVDAILAEIDESLAGN
jgi:hypothetical protein